MYNRGPAFGFLARHACLTLGTATLVSLLISTPLAAQDTKQPSRKVVHRVDADYPIDLQRAHIGGTVRLEVVVTPTGNPDKITVVGGNPVLVETAMRAVKKWKWAAAQGETTIRVNVQFDPDQK